jgi:hypothetical protein
MYFFHVFWVHVGRCYLTGPMGIILEHVQLTHSTPPPAATSTDTGYAKQALYVLVSCLLGLC